MKKISSHDQQNAMISLELLHYDSLPTFGIYADQLISLVNDIVKFSYMPEEKILTASMVNNYVKHGVLSKPSRKKYTQDHIAHLIVVCILKKVFSIHEISEFIRLQSNSNTTKEFFDSFIITLKRSLAEVFAEDTLLPEMQQSPDDATAHNLMQDESYRLIKSAVDAFSNKLSTQRFLYDRIEKKK